MWALRLVFWFIASLVVCTGVTSTAIAAEATASKLEDARAATSLARERLAQGDFAGAETAVKQALDVQRRELGPQDLMVATSLARLALLNLARGGAANAITLYMQALAIRERRLGYASSGVAHILDDLALAHIGSVSDEDPASQQHEGLAESLLRRSLAIRERALGPMHPDVAVSLYNLARIEEILTHSKPNPSRVRPLFARALAIREKAFGERSAPVVDALERLARFDGATSVSAGELERAIAIQEMLYGANAKELVNDLIALAQRRFDVENGDSAAAAQLVDRLLTIEEATFDGADAWRFGQTRSLIAGHRTKATVEKVNVWMKRALGVDERLAGDFPCPRQSPSTRARKLVATFDGQERIDAVEEIDTSMLPLSNGLLAAPICGFALAASLAREYEAAGDFESAERLSKKGLALKETSLGANDVRIIPAIDSLAAFYERRGRAAEAESLSLRELEILDNAPSAKERHDIYGNRDFHGVVDRLTRLYLASGRASDALPLNLRALRLEDSDIPADQGPQIARLNHLSDIYVALGRNGDAEARLVEAVTITETAAGSSANTGLFDGSGKLEALLAALERLAAFYDSRGRGDDAYASNRRALDIALKPYTDDKPGSSFHGVSPGGYSPPPIVRRLAAFADFCDKHGRAEEAKQWLKRARGILENDLRQDISNAATLLTGDTFNWYIAPRLARLIAVYRANGDGPRAIETAERLVSVARAHLGRDDFEALALLADVYDEQGRSNDAKPLRQRASALKAEEQKTEMGKGGPKP